MKFAKCATVLLGWVFHIVNAQDNLAVIGFGPGSELFQQANEHPLNKTDLAFPGFNLTADPASNANASAGNWTLSMGLSIIDLKSNRTNYPVSAAPNSSYNTLNVAYSLEFPGGQLPSPNDTDWSICMYIVDVPWTTSVLDRASGDSGDCATVLGASCLDQVRQGWQTPSSRASSGCPRTPDITNLAECKSISTNGYGSYSTVISSVFSMPDNSSAPTVGLSSGQVFSYESSTQFNASSAVANYNEFASKLRMTVLRFAPSVAYTTTHAGSFQVGEVRTFCNILNEQAPRQNSGNRLRLSSASQIVMGLPMLLLVWEALSTLNV